MRHSKGKFPGFSGFSPDDCALSAAVAANIGSKTPGFHREIRRILRDMSGVPGIFPVGVFCGEALTVLGRLIESPVHGEQGSERPAGVENGG